jgi:hypothetical protein
MPLDEKLRLLPPRAHAAACGRSLVATPDGPCLRMRRACVCKPVAAALPHILGIRALDVGLHHERVRHFDCDESSNSDTDSDADSGGTAHRFAVTPRPGAADKYRALLRAVVAMPQPLALRWRSGTLRLQDLCPAAAPHLVHLSIFGKCGAGLGTGMSELVLRGAQDCLRCLQRRGALRSLALREHCFNGSGLAQFARALARLTALTRLDLSALEMPPTWAAADSGTSAFVATLPQLRALHALLLPEVQGSLEPFSSLAPALACLPELTQLNMAWGLTSPDNARVGRPVLARFTRLQDLTIADRQKDPDYLQHTLALALPALGSLTRIALVGVDITSSDCVHALITCAALQKLALLGGAYVSDEAFTVAPALAVAAGALTALTSLVVDVVSSPDPWSPITLAALISAPSLRSIHLGGWDFGEAQDGRQDAEVLLALGRASRLTRLRLSSEFEMFDENYEGAEGSGLLDALCRRGCKVDWDRHGAD